MAGKVYNVLFLCTGNSARSIMAEVLLNQMGRENFRAYSAGSYPTGRVNPFAIETLSRARLPTEGLSSKSWNEFAADGAPQLDFVFTVCDNAAGEVCPVWPGQPMSAHWGMEDPAEVTGTEEQIDRKFRDTAMLLKRRIELLLSLPLRSLDRLSLQKQLQDIGRK